MPTPQTSTQNERPRAHEARGLIEQLIAPDDAMALPDWLRGEQRLRMLLYILREQKFQAAGVRCMAQFPVAGDGRGPYSCFTDVYAIAVRDGGVEEMFSLTRKIKVSIDQDDDLDRAVLGSVKKLSALRGDALARAIIWEECYPEPMKQKHLLAEIHAEPGSSRKMVENLRHIANTWQLQRSTVPAAAIVGRPRL